MPEVFPRAQRSYTLNSSQGNGETQRREQLKWGTRRWTPCPFSLCHQESKLPLTDLSYNCVLFKVLFSIMQKNPQQTEGKPCLSVKL